MLPESPAVGSMSTVNSRKKLAGFGYREPDDLGRCVIYTAKPIHLATVDNGTDNNETLFTRHRQHGITATAGDADKTLLDVVDVLSEFATNPFNLYVGIRISASDNPEYASKIVFYKEDGVRIEWIVKQISKVMYEHINATLTRYVTHEEPSATESRDYRIHDTLED